MTTKSVVLVTGATGFVGRALVPMLGDEVRVALRTNAGNAACCESVVVGNVDSLTEWKTALQNVSCIVHLAAHVHVMKQSADDQRHFYETNVLGTERLARAAVENGVQRFIFLSSVKVNGESTQQQAFKWNDIPRPIDNYGISKWRAERSLFEIAAKSNMHAVAVRPPLVYGPGVRANFLRLLSWVHQGIPLPFGKVVNARSMISIWNLCDLIKRLIDIPSPQRGVLMASDGKDVSTPDLIKLLAFAMNRPRRLMSMPIDMLKIVGMLAGKSKEVSRLSDSLQIDIAETCLRLDWHPPVSVQEGMRRTVDWYLESINGN